VVTSSFRRDAADSVWSTAYINNLEDECFLYIEPGGTKDESGKTTPRDLRHFPFKDASGKVDLVHVKNALSRIPQADVPAAAKAAATKKAQSLLEAHRGDAVTRYDRGVGQLLRPFRRDTDGAVLYECQVAHPGVLIYQNADGSTRRELVPAETLTDPAWLESLARATVTLQHPPEEVRPETYQKYSVGDTTDPDASEVTAAGGHVRIKLAVRRKDALDAVRDGVVEISPGYQVTCAETPGVDPVHGRYDAIQIARRANHLAIVDAARGGNTCHLRADGHQETPAWRASPRKEVNVKLLEFLLAQGVTRADADTLVNDASMSPAMAALAAAHDKLHEKLSAAEQELAEEKAAHATTKGSADAMKKAYDDLMAERGGMEAQVPPSDKKDAKEPLADLAIRYGAAVMARRELAKRMGVDKFDSMAPADLDKAIVLKSDAKAPQNEAPAYYRARADGIAALPVVDPAREAWNAPKGASFVPPTVRVDGLDARPNETWLERSMREDAEQKNKKAAPAQEN